MKEKYTQLQNNKIKTPGASLHLNAYFITAARIQNRPAHTFLHLIMKTAGHRGRPENPICLPVIVWSGVEWSGSAEDVRLLIIRDNRGRSINTRFTLRASAALCRGCVWGPGPPEQSHTGFCTALRGRQGRTCAERSHYRAVRHPVAKTHKHTNPRVSDL